MKKTVFSISAMLAALVFAAPPPPAAPPRARIVATTFPIYDWTRQILGDNAGGAELVLLLRSGADLHSYIPTAADLRVVAACDLFIYNGGESDSWAPRVLAQDAKPGRRVLNLMQTLGAAAKEEKHAEGMEHGHACHDAACHNEARHGGERELDEHVWLSLRHAATLVEAIANEICAIDPANAQTYRANASAYRQRLAALDAEYAAAVASARRKTILVADRFPFRYLADDYSLAFHAAFPGCSAESEASFKTIAFLARKLDELRLPVILTTESPNSKIAEAVRRATKTRDQRILALDSLQSTGADAAGTTRYLDAMKRNLEVLKAALN